MIWLVLESVAMPNWYRLHSKAKWDSLTKHERFWDTVVKECDPSRSAVSTACHVSQGALATPPLAWVGHLPVASRLVTAQPQISSMTSGRFKIRRLFMLSLSHRQRPNFASRRSVACVLLDPS
jgi:hypothetical protein